MKNYICRLAVLCVFLTFPVFAQPRIDGGLDEKPEFAQKADVAKGKLLLRYARSGKPREDWQFTDFDVVLVRIGTTWTIVGKAGDRQLDITLDEEKQTLKFVLDKYVWNLKTTSPKISITTAADRPEILIRFLADIEASGYTGRHYNLMKGSTLAVKASND